MVHLKPEELEVDDDKLVWMLDVHTEPQLLQHASLGLDDIVLECDILRVEDHGFQRLPMSHLLDVMEDIDDVTGSSWTLFYFAR